jgi:hypothetical protein
MATLRERLLKSIRLIEEHEEFSETDFRWAETKQGEDRAVQSDDKAEVYINRKAFEAAGSGPGYKDKMLLAESLHQLKVIEPERYNRMEADALTDPDYREWAEESARREGILPEDFARWHRKSRFDQVIGGYLFAGDKDIPTMKGWKREGYPWGKKLRAELEALAKELEMQ